MPTKIKLNYASAADPFKVEEIETDVATEEELLEFANRVRQLGGANALEALLPSDVGAPSSCLIANALNFECHVYGCSGFWPTGEPKWAMYFPYSTALQTIEDIGNALGCEVRSGGAMILPREIGNAARAFDEGKAFTHLITERADYAG